MISIKSVSTLSYEGICTQSRNVEDFKKCVDDLKRKPIINKIEFKSYKQSYELQESGVTDFIHPGKHSINEELSPKLFLNKVSILISNICVLHVWLSVSRLLFIPFGSKLCVDS